MVNLEIIRQEAIVKTLSDRLDRIASSSTTGQIRGDFSTIIDQLKIESAVLEALKEAIPQQVTEIITEQIPTTIDSLFTEQIIPEVIIPQTQDNTLRNALLIGGAILLLA